MPEDDLEADFGYDVESDARHRVLRDLFLIDPEVAYLNHGAFGACPRPVFEHYQRWQLDLERQPVEFLGRRARQLLADARARLADYLGADDDELVYYPNVTTALNAVARSLRLEPGDEILTTDHEYGALSRTWEFVAERCGARVVVVPVATPVHTLEAIEEAVWAARTPRTRVLFLSHITSPTAVTFPIQPLIARARAAGLTTIVDGAHAPGQLPVDLHALGADFYGGNCHKWLCAPKGAGFLYARRDVQPLLDPLIVSWGWRPEDPSGSRFVDEHERQATRDLAAYLAVPAAIDFQAAHAWPRVRAECHLLLRAARARVSALTGHAPVVADSPALFAQMATVPVSCVDGEALKRRLYDEFLIEVPVLRWNNQTHVRMSVQGYNTRADVERFVQALAILLADGV